METNAKRKMCGYKDVKRSWKKEKKKLKGFNKTRINPIGIIMNFFFFNVGNEKKNSNDSIFF